MQTLPISILEFALTHLKVKSSGTIHFLKRQDLEGRVMVLVCVVVGVVKLNMGVGRVEEGYGGGRDLYLGFVGSLRDLRSVRTVIRLSSCERGIST